MWQANKRPDDQFPSDVLHRTQRDECVGLGWHLQFAGHDHLGLVRVDRAALLEQVNCCLVAIHKQQALPENVEVDQFACSTRHTSASKANSRQSSIGHARYPTPRDRKPRCSPNCCAHFWAGNHSPVNVMSLRFPMTGSPLGPGGKESLRCFCWKPAQTKYAATRAARQTMADIFRRAVTDPRRARPE